jgi:MFS family permease
VVSWRGKTYEKLPALSIRGPELRRALRLVTAAWGFGIVWMTIVTGSRLTNFARMMGLSDRHFGWLAALPFVASLGQLVAAVLIERTGLRKFQFMQCAIVHRLLWIPVALVPLLYLALWPLVGPGVASTLAVWSMLLLILGSHFMNALAAPAWLNWMGDLIPRRIRGRYFALRQIVSQVIKIPCVIGLAVLMDYLTVPDAPMTVQDQPALLTAICVLFVAAAVSGMTDILLFRSIREVVRPTRERPREPAVNVEVRSAGPGAAAKLGYGARYAGEAARQLVLDPLGDRVFRRYVLYGATAVFAMAVSGQFFWRWCLETMHFSQFATDSLFMIIGPTFGILASRPAGKLLDRWGRRPVLLVGTFLTVFSVLPYFLASPNTPTPQFAADAINGLGSLAGQLVGRPGWQPIGEQTPLGGWMIMVCSMVLGGAGWTTIGLGKQNVILGFSDGGGRSKYIAASSVMIGIGGILGGLVGGEVAEQLRYYQDHPVVVGPFLFNNWHATFLLSFLARATALVWLIKMPDPGARTVRAMLGHIGSTVYSNMSSRFLWPLRIFGWGESGRRRRRWHRNGEPGADDRNGSSP